MHFKSSYVFSSTSFSLCKLSSSVNYLEKTFPVIWIKSYFTLHHLLIFFFYESSCNFQAVCLTFSCSLESSFRSEISIFLLSLSSQLILPVFASVGRLSIGYLDRTNTRLEWNSSLSLSFSFAPRGFLATRFGPSNQCVVLTFRRRASGKWSRRCCTGFNRSVEKLRNFLPEIGRRRIPGCDSRNRISNYLNRCAVGVRGSGTSSGASAFQRFASRYLSAWFVSVLVALLQRGSNYRYKTT